MKLVDVIRMLIGLTGIFASHTRQARQGQKVRNNMKTDDKCQECKKDWTKCTKCPVMMKWVMEHKASPTGAEGARIRNE